MRTLRIFISSPGDVAAERERAREVVESLRRRYARRFHLKPILWEDLPLQPDMGFQQGIDVILSDHGADIAIFILWSRLGSPTGSGILKDDGSQYRSGTERELDLMLKARAHTRSAEGKARPHILVYTRKDEASFSEKLRDATSTTDKKHLILQKELVESFIEETFQDQETKTNIGAYFPFDRPVTFSQRLRVHLQELLDGIAGGSDDILWDTATQGPPFLGLEAFQPRHADIFFGREEETLEARHALREQARSGCAFLLLSGASGSGKSSLARAGILPEITTLELDEHVASWRTLILTPSELGTDPVAALLTRLAEDSLLPDLRSQSTALDALARDLEKDPTGIFKYTMQKAIEAASLKAGAPLRVLLLIDQLEELFTGALAPERRTAFLSVLETFARSGLVWIVATVRSDFYQQVQSEPALVRMKEGRGLFDVLPPPPDALQRLIEEPARLAGLSFEERGGQSLASLILRDAAPHAELLPLVEFVLLELYEQRSDARQLTFAAYEALGGVDGALAKKAEEAFLSLSADAQASLGQVLQSLVTLGNEGTDDETEKAVRQHAPLSNFQAGGGAGALITTFTAARLFTTGTSASTTEPTVTLAHESLLRVWPRAVEWRKANVDFLRTRARIAARMKEGSPLLAGDPLLDSAKAFLSTRADGFTQAQRDWIQSSLAAADNKQRRAVRRRRLAFATLSCLTLLALLGAAWALKREQDAKIARSTAEGLIHAMLFDLRDSLAPLGRLDLLDDVSRQAEAYFAENPPESAASKRNESVMWTSRGDVLKDSGDLTAARRAYQRSFEIAERLATADPRAALLQRDLSISLQRLGEVATAEGDLAAARQAYQRSEEVARILATSEPQNIKSMADWSTSLIKLGNTSSAEGDLDGARRAYQQSLEINQRLATTDPQNDLAQRNWSVSLQKIGDVAAAEGDLAAASQAYRQSLAINANLAAADPSNAESQRHWSSSLSKVGDVAVAEGDLTAARKLHEQSLEIAQRLADADPRNTQAQDILGGSLQRVANLAKAAGDHQVAREAYQRFTEISQTLAKGDPSNVEVQRSWSISLEALGDVERAEGNLAAARASYQQSIEIAKKLTEIEPGSVSNLRRLGVSLQRLGSVAVAEGDLILARKSYQESHDILKQRAEIDQDNLQAQIDWTISLHKLAELAISEGDLAAARKLYQQSIEIREQLAAKNPHNAGVQRDWRISLVKFGDVASSEDDFAAAHRAYLQALEIAQQLAEADPRNAGVQRDIWVSFWNLADTSDKQNAADAIEWWQKAYRQITLMKEMGTLAPADERFIASLREKAALPADASR